jgi:hypothetical protein
MSDFDLTMWRENRAKPAAVPVSQPQPVRARKQRTGNPAVCCIDCGRPLDASLFSHACEGTSGLGE